MDGQIDQTARPTIRMRPAERAPGGPAVALPLGSASPNGSARIDSDDSSAGQMESFAQPRADDEWRQWIAENLMIGEPAERMMDALTSKGFTSEEAALELKAAEESPYLKGAELLLNRIRKREWLLEVYRKNHRLHPESSEIERRHRLPRFDLLRDYYSTNRPVIITGRIDDWPAMRKWSLDYFAETFGDRQVDVRMPRTPDSKNNMIVPEPYVDRIRFGDFVKRMRTADETDDFYLIAHHTSLNRTALGGLWDDIVPIPEYLAADRPGGSIWIAPRGTITPFHHNLTNSLQAQALGRTRVKIAPSWDIPLMYNQLHWFSRVDGRLVPADSRPPDDLPQIHELILDPGEVLFLPVGWLHHIEAIEIAVTVSFANFVFDNDFASFYTTYGLV